MPYPSRSFSVGNLWETLQYWQDRLPPRPWHAGRTVGRTLYKGWGGAEDMVGVMDDPEHATFVACMRNVLPELIALAREFDRYDGEAIQWRKRSKLGKIWEVLCARDDPA